MKVKLIDFDGENEWIIVFDKPIPPSCWKYLRRKAKLNCRKSHSTPEVLCIYGSEHMKNIAINFIENLPIKRLHKGKSKTFNP